MATLLVKKALWPVGGVVRVGMAWLLAAALAGCAGVKVSATDPAEDLAQRRSDVLSTGKLSPATQESLRVLGEDQKTCLSDAPRCRHLIGQTQGLNDEQRLSALAELWAHAAIDIQNQTLLNQRRSLEDFSAWLESARHAWAYLFYTERSPSARALEYRQTQVRDYYNHATQQAITGLFALSQVSALDKISGRVSEVGNWHINIDLEGVRLPTSMQAPHELLPAAALTFSGLRNVYRRDGVGAELVAVFEAPNAAEAVRSAQLEEPYQEALYPAITGLLRFEGRNLDEVLVTRQVRLQVLDPYRFNAAIVQDVRVPLAGNFTSGYGLWLARSGFSTQALRSLIGLNNGIVRPKVYLMQPYDPKRHTIVMLHGLASSPEAWINVANEVLGDETLRSNFQIWQVYYPTNAPIPLNNRAIREVLDATFAHFDPQGTARASRNVTLVGHSMGGVLSRLMVTNTDGQLVASVQEDLGLQAADRKRLRGRLQEYLEFSALPQVDRAIFVAAPHRGTDFANNRVARWAANLITLPFSMIEQVADLTATLAHASPRMGKNALLRIPNSIDNLSSEDSFLQMTANLPTARHVTTHSILGNDTPNQPLAQSSDGIVPYSSAHWPGAASELVVPFGHSVQEHPRAILEIRRILHEQLQRSQAAPAARPSQK